MNTLWVFFVIMLLWDPSLTEAGNLQTLWLHKYSYAETRWELITAWIRPLQYLLWTHNISAHELIGMISEAVILWGPAFVGIRWDSLKSLVLTGYWTQILIIWLCSWFSSWMLKMISSFEELKCFVVDVCLLSLLFVCLYLNHPMCGSEFLSGNYLLVCVT